MKSLIAVVVLILCVQSVCSQLLIDMFINGIKDSPVREEITRIVDKCDFSQIQYILERNPQNFCSTSKRDRDLTHFNNFLKLCVKFKYYQVINRMHKVAENVFKILCESSDKNLKELIVILKNKSMDPLYFFNQIVLQASSCVFSEKEVMEASKSVDTVLEFYVNLIQGHEQQCGVVQRIQKCILNNKLNFTEKVFVERIGALVDTFLTAFDCTFDIDERTSLDFDVKAPATLNTFQEKYNEAVSSCDANNLGIVSLVLDFQINLLSLPELVVENYDNICNVQNMFDYLNYEPEIEALKGCIDPSYVEYVDKIRKLVVREYEFYCSKKNRTMEVATEMQKVNSICLKQNQFRLYGCLFSSGQIRDAIEDSNLVSNYTLGLLDGNVKECEAIDEIKNCMIETIDKCNDDSLTTILNYAYDATKNMFGCKVKLCKEFTFKNFNVPFKKC